MSNTNNANAWLRPDAQTLAARLKETVIGQDTAIDRLAHDLAMRCREPRPGRPLAVYLLCGPAGVGKTLLGRRLAGALDAPAEHFFSLAEYGHALHSISFLFGCPPGYSGGKGQLTGAVAKLPRSVVLLDDIAMAHPDVLKRLAAMWHDGIVWDDHTGQSHCIEATAFVLTTFMSPHALAGITESGFRSEDEIEAEARKMLAAADYRALPGWFLEAIDRVIVLRQLEGSDVALVIAMQIERLAHSYGLEITDDGIGPQILLAAVERDAARLGRRGNVREVGRAVEDVIADGLIDAKEAGASVVRFSAAEGLVLVQPVR